MLQGGAANTSHFSQGYVTLQHNSQAYTYTEYTYTDVPYHCHISLPVFVPPPVALIVK